MTRVRSVTTTGFVALTALLALTGCGAHAAASSAPPTSAPSSRAVAATVAASSSTSGASGASGSSGASVRECRAADVRLSLGRADGTAGAVVRPVVMRNTSSSPCRTGGYGGVSLVGGGDGTQIGAAADRVARSSRTSIVLLPNAHATARLKIAEAGNYPTARCRPSRADGLRIYIPDETRSRFLATTGVTGCRAGGVHLLTLTPYQPVR